MGATASSLKDAFFSNAELVEEKAEESNVHYEAAIRLRNKFASGHSAFAKRAIVNMENCDPRSPTLNVKRTPLKFSGISKQKIALLEQYLDPRFPTQGVERTPLKSIPVLSYGTDEPAEPVEAPATPTPAPRLNLFGTPCTPSAPVPPSPTTAPSSVSQQRRTPLADRESSSFSAFRAHVASTTSSPSPATIRVRSSVRLASPAKALLCEKENAAESASPSKRASRTGYPIPSALTRTAFGAAGQQQQVVDENAPVVSV